MPEMNQKRDQSGSAMIECALVLPVILLIIFGGFELANGLSAIQAANFLSREVAVVAYRDCAFDNSSATATTPATSYLNAETCLNAVVTKYQNETAPIMPDTNFALSLYTISGSVVTRTAGVESGGVSSRYTTTNFNSSADALNQAFTATLNQHRIVVVSEVFVPRESVRGSIPRFWNYSFFTGAVGGFLPDGPIHAATVF